MACVFFVNRRTTWEFATCVVGSEMCIRESICVGGVGGARARARAPHRTNKDVNATSVFAFYHLSLIHL